jgi:hypothetical protein
VEERGVGIALKSFSEIDKALAYLTSDDTLTAYRTRALALRNRAVVEIPEILAGILDDVPGSLVASRF